MSRTNDGLPDPTTEWPGFPTSTPDSVASTEPTEAANPIREVVPSVRPLERPSHVSGVLGQLFWILCCGAFIVGLWQVGPIIAERYQFALTRGKARAEYEIAKQALSDAPLSNVSYLYQLVAQKIKPSVVSIECDKGRAQGQGSGIILTSDGFIATNDHVVKNSSEIFVTLFDRHVYAAKLVGSDPITDLAVIKITAENLFPAEWGDSDSLAVGSMVWAVGSPYGFSQTVTSGIISGKNRMMIDPATMPEDYRKAQLKSRYQELLQTDAAVNPGNSGGPLVDSTGKVVGINTSILGDSYQGISFAIPSSVAEFVINQLIGKGTVHRGFLGFTPTNITQPLMEFHNLTDLKGALVSQVQPDSPASKGGLREGDVIRAWNGEEIDDYNRVYNLIGVTTPSKTVDIEILREGQPITLTVTVTERPADLDR